MPSLHPIPRNISGEVEADFVVAGSGAAGLTGALAAAADGAHVCLLEKTPLIGGTTALSGGAQWIPLNHHMAKVGVTDSREDALTYLRACASANTDDEILVTLVDQGAPMLARIESLGVRPSRPWPAVGGTYDYRPWLPGAKQGGRALQPDKFALAELREWAPRLRVGTAWDVDLIDYYADKLYLSPPRAARASAIAGRANRAAPSVSPELVGCGTSLVGELLKACLSQGVHIQTETRADSLVVEQGRIVAVRATSHGQQATIHARHGILMATGGYSGNELLRRQWLSRPMITTCEIAENTGDGHLMGMAVGAQVANLGDAWWLPYIHVGVDDHGAIKNIARSREDRTLPHTMIVNRQGRRFINEALNYYDFAEGFGSNSSVTARNIPAWLIFDRQGVERYAMLAAKVPTGPTPGWLTVAASLPELASRLGIDEAGLKETAERFNIFAMKGRDLDYDRGENSWDIAWGDPANTPNPSLGTIKEPPFYAVEVLPGALATKGGLRVNGKAQVLSASAPFHPIAGLYAAGNCSNAAPAGSYPGPGTTIGAAMTFAYVAARQVAVEMRERQACSTLDARS